MGTRRARLHQEAQSRKRWGHLGLTAQGSPCPVAGRSLRTSCPSLTACRLRFAILASLAAKPGSRARAAPSSVLPKPTGRKAAGIPTHAGWCSSRPAVRPRASPTRGLVFKPTGRKAAGHCPWRPSGDGECTALGCARSPRLTPLGFLVKRMSGDPLPYGRHSRPRIETSSSGPFGWHQASTAASRLVTPASTGAEREAAMQAAIASSP